MNTKEAQESLGFVGVNNRLLCISQKQNLGAKVCLYPQRHRHRDIIRQEIRNNSVSFHIRNAQSQIGRVYINQTCQMRLKHGIVGLATVATKPIIVLVEYGAFSLSKTIRSLQRFTEICNQYNISTERGRVIIIVSRLLSFAAISRNPTTIVFN